MFDSKDYYAKNRARILAKKAAERRAAGAKPQHRMKGTPEYKAWQGIKDRCLNPRSKLFPDYGGRGITVCERWRSSFAAFLSDMGPRTSPEHSIDRKDNSGHYGPGNCRWATYEEQNRNRRRSKFSGKLCASDVAFIRHWGRRGHRTSSIAKAFGVHDSHVWRICAGQSWQERPPP